MKEDKGYGCCLIEAIVLIIILFVLPKYTKNIGKEYLVEQTNYIHSTDDKDKCRFIASAKDRKYKISRISREDALKQKKLICKECYPADVQKKYNNALQNILQEELVRKQYSDDMAAWESLENDNSDFSKLFVYMETNGTLHIYGNCYEAKGKLVRIRFADIDTIKTTCEDCVGREYCDFIYKKLYEGIYDTNQIKEVEEDY